MGALLLLFVPMVHASGLNTTINHVKESVGKVYEFTTSAEFLFVFFCVLAVVAPVAVVLSLRHVIKRLSKGFDTFSTKEHKSIRLLLVNNVYDNAVVPLALLMSLIFISAALGFIHLPIDVDGISFSSALWFLIHATIFLTACVVLTRSIDAVVLTLRDAQFVISSKMFDLYDKLATPTATLVKTLLVITLFVLISGVAIFPSTASFQILLTAASVAAIGILGFVGAGLADIVREMAVAAELMVDDFIHVGDDIQMWSRTTGFARGVVKRTDRRCGARPHSFLLTGRGLRCCRAQRAVPLSSLTKCLPSCLLSTTPSAAATSLRNASSFLVFDPPQHSFFVPASAPAESIRNLLEAVKAKCVLNIRSIYCLGSTLCATS